jgi:anti-sigma factor RsiW
MNCSEAREIIQLYIDSELDCRDTLEVQRHIESCASCASLLDSFIKQDQSLKQAARAEEMDCAEFRAQVLADIRRRCSESSGRRVSAPMWRRAAAVAAVVFIASLLLLWGWPGSVVNDKVYASAIKDHAHHCSLDRLMKAASDPAEIDKLVSQYSPLKKPPDLSAFGLSDVRAKVCMLNEVKSLHIVYQREGGQPLSIFLRPHADDLANSRLIADARDGFTVASATDSGFDVVVVSSMDEKPTRQIVQAVIEQMKARS